MLPTNWGEGWPNVWLGTTTENQEEANRRIPHLIAIPAAVRFLSVEPMLEPVEVAPWLLLPPHDMRAPISWIIVGGESGGNARLMHPDWVRGLRDQVHGRRRQALREADRQQSRAVARGHRQGRRPSTMAGRFAGAGIPAMKSYFRCGWCAVVDAARRDTCSRAEPPAGSSNWQPTAARARAAAAFPLIVRRLLRSVRATTKTIEYRSYSEVPADLDVVRYWDLALALISLCCRLGWRYALKDRQFFSRWLSS